MASHESWKWGVSKHTRPGGSRKVIVERTGRGGSKLMYVLVFLAGAAAALAASPYLPL